MLSSAAQARASDGVRSHLPDGRSVVWHPPARPDVACAVDAEPAGAAVSQRLARRALSDDPGVVWPLWTRAEAVAKLLGLPVLSWLTWPGLVIPSDLAARVALATFTVADLGGAVLVTCGATCVPQPPAQA